ncbi:MAG: invasion associated locus B family protein [Thalassovita sp.]
MFKPLTTLPFALMMALAAPLAAQQADAPKTEEAKPAADAGLDMGQEVKDSVQPYFREESGDWKLECLKTGQDAEPCQLFQAAFDDQGNQLSNIRLFRLPEGGPAVAGAVIAVPLEVLLTGQLTLTVDEGKTKRYPFSVCDPLGCYARIGLTTEEISELKRGAKATIQVVPFVAPNERMTVTLSLKGFTAGFDKITPIEMPN